MYWVERHVNSIKGIFMLLDDDNGKWASDEFTGWLELMGVKHSYDEICDVMIEAGAECERGCKFAEMSGLPPGEEGRRCVGDLEVFLTLVSVIHSFIHYSSYG